MIVKRVYKNEDGESIWTFDTNKNPHNPIRVEHKYSDEWKETETIEISETGNFSIRPKIKKEGKEYQVRAFIDLLNLRVYGDILQMKF